MKFMPSPSLLKSWLDAVDGDEKFVLVVGCGLADFILLWFGKLDATTYVTLTTLTIVAYLTGKAVEVVTTTNAASRTEIARTEATATIATATAATADSNMQAAQSNAAAAISNSENRR